MSSWNILMDLVLLGVSRGLLPGWLDWLREHFEVLLWLLAPAQVVCVFAMAVALEFPRIPKWVPQQRRSLYRLAEVVYGMGFVLAIGMLLWDYLFLPKHPIGYAWSLSVALFGSMFAVGMAQEERFGEVAWWRKLPIWAFLFFAVLMTLARPWGAGLRLAALTVSYLPARLSLSWGVEISLWDLCSALLSWIVLVFI
ncbi:hypothetical protein JST97_00385 [bacterium]|nr:hypothetical protein [bacterium]